MNIRTQLGRADLLACLQRHGEAEWEAVAAAFGYARPKPPETKKPSVPPRPKPSPPSAPPSVESEPVKPVAKPRARFYRVVAQRELERDEAVRETPEWFRDAASYHRPVTAKEDAPPPPSSPSLMRWSRLWPFLKAALGAQWEIQALDIPRIVELVARGRTLRYFPRQRRHGWAARCQIILDYTEPLLPFWDDFNELRQRLPELRGKQGLELIAFPDGDPGGRCWRYSGREWREIGGYRLPAPGAPVLVLSDLGCIDKSDIRRRQWHRLGVRLQRSDYRPVALMPCPPRWWDRELIRLFYPVCWDRAARPPQRFGGVCLPPAPTEREAPDAGAEQLLALLAPAIRIEPALLRAVRHLLPSWVADVGSEAAAWNHPKVHSTPLAFYYDGKAIEQYRRLAREAEYAGLRDSIAALIVAHHAHLSPAIGHEEQLLIQNLWGNAPEPGVAQEFIERIVKTLHGQDSALAEGMADWVQRSSRRLHAGMLANDALVAAKAMVYLRQRREDRETPFPDDIELAQVSWLLSQEQAPRRYALRQRGQGLCLEEEVSAGPELDAPGSLVAEIRAQASYVQYRWLDERDIPLGDKQTPALEERIPLPASGRLRVQTDCQEVTVESIERPDWADAMGRDEYGLYADFSINGVSQRMRWIAPGSFMMGSPESEAERVDDEVQHRVVLGRGFWLADTACSQAMWEAVMGDNPSGFKGEGRPVESVSWINVQRFIELLNKEIFGEEIFRLPTEAEWEYACRAGTTTPFWFGDQITPDQVNYNGEYPYAGGKKGRYRQETVAVKALRCNDWGLYQMHGNVWEWCQDWRDEYDLNVLVDPTGPAKGQLRVLRGGCWDNFGGHVRSAQRYAFGPGGRLGNVGFRLARGQASGQEEAGGKSG